MTTSTSKTSITIIDSQGAKIFTIALIFVMAGLCVLLGKKLAYTDVKDKTPAEINDLVAKNTKLFKTGFIIFILVVIAIFITNEHK